MALTVDDIISRCQDAIREHTPSLAVRDVLDELVADPGAVDQAVGPVETGGITPLHNAADLTILRVAWTPGMALNPHEHRMWAVIGMYGGQEDNAFYRRAPGGLETAGGKEIPAGDVLVLGDDVIHSVANSRREFAVALHVYGGDFFTVERSEWDFGTYEERPRDFERTRRMFEEANARWREADVIHRVNVRTIQIDSRVEPLSNPAVTPAVRTRGAPCDTCEREVRARRSSASPSSR